jgi:hypothetical protein
VRLSSNAAPPTNVGTAAAVLADVLSFVGGTSSGRPYLRDQPGRCTFGLATNTPSGFSGFPVRASALFGSRWRQLSGRGLGVPVAACAVTSVTHHHGEQETVIYVDPIVVNFEPIDETQQEATSLTHPGGLGCDSP